MATVVWTASAQLIRYQFYLSGKMEFGTITANKTDRKIEEIIEFLSKYPETGFPEPLLKGTPFLYRARHINKRYKLIYRYEEINDTVYIEDIWDSRRSPQNLTKRIVK